MCTRDRAMIDPDRNVFLIEGWDSIVVETALYDGGEDAADFDDQNPTRSRHTRRGVNK